MTSQLNAAQGATPDASSDTANTARAQQIQELLPEFAQYYDQLHSCPHYERKYIMINHRDLIERMEAAGITHEEMRQAGLDAGLIVEELEIDDMEIGELVRYIVTQLAAIVSLKNKYEQGDTFERKRYDLAKDRAARAAQKADQSADKDKLAAA